MNRIAWLSNYREKNGYSYAQQNIILALDSVGAEVIPRYIRMTEPTDDIPNRIKELENGDLNNIDVIIQHCLPNTFGYKNGVKNVGTYYYEGDHFSNTNWQQHLDLMDVIIVSCQHQLQQLSPKNREKAKVIPIPVNMSKFDKTYPKNSFGMPESTLKFYTICENGKRKNLQAMILAYSAVFTSTDDVVLIIKTSGDKNAVKNMINEIRDGTNRFIDKNKYPKIIVVTDHLSEEELNSLHQNADIFISTSHSESWQLPAIDAAGFNNLIIATNYSSFLDYPLYGITPILVNGSETSIFGVNNAPQGLYTSDETWYNINHKELAETLNYVYSHYKYGGLNIKKTDIAVFRDKLSYQTVGKQLIEALS